MELHIRHLTHSFALTEVLSDINLDLHAGETLALVGPSGCGKSTLLHIVAGLLRPSEGTLESSFRGIGCMFQQPRLMPWKNVVDNIALGLKGLGIPAGSRRRQGAALALRMGLLERDMDKFPYELSGGMQSRVALARALATRPDLLLLDEPFAALDVGLRHELYGVLREQVRGTGAAVLMITHDLMEAVRLADRLLLMAPHPGRVLREFMVPRLQERRSDDWIYGQTGRLMRIREVRECFGLPLQREEGDHEADPTAADDGGVPGGMDDGVRALTGASANCAAPHGHRGGCVA
ncbi:ATP-binding cassette domain-containing protein [Corticibacter populi]|uniref:ATP-binding cassette domain-containing protein n=1 Tax=Corticibacter populi TaxID=1550736 RepID=A0A3M6QYJ6_9BURK|nr:ATP-binding cassette domain-containing protein [Corticibacter populi]RMX08094.1 ATP-binding cassette domain-containing protein [Corticibacter populi]RZS35342.1 NitT/TauT family transport system ATP-binding protein [Corticibacter populi]